MLQGEGWGVMRPGPLAPVVALDIDGTSGDYHSHFIQFAKAWTGRDLPSATQYTGGVPFHKYLGISRSTYNQIKLAYRHGGLKRSMPVYPGIGEFTKHIRTNGVQVWICTTRPYLNLSNIDPDTRHWITKRAHMQYDGILYGPHKYRDLVKAVGVDRVVVVYDDLPRLIDQALSLDLPSCMRLQPYNTYWDEPDSNVNYWVARNVLDMAIVFDQALKEWRKNHA
jgi:hypothetical protein